MQQAKDAQVRLVRFLYCDSGGVIPGKTTAISGLQGRLRDGIGLTLAMMLVTALGFGGSFAAFTFITPILTGVTGFSLATASVLLIVFGAATFVGNLVGGRLTGRFGWQRAVRLMLVLLALAQVILALTLSSQLVTVIMLFVWGLLAFGMSPSFQAGMLATAERYTPTAVDFASGLNISAFNIGISLGAFVGGVMVSGGLMSLTPWAGVAVSILALVPLKWLSRKEARHQVPANEPPTSVAPALGELVEVGSR